MRWIGCGRQRVIAVVLALILVSLGAPMSAQRVEAAPHAVVGVDLLNIRSDPGTWAEVVGVVGYGEWLDVWDGPTGDGWFRIHYSGVSGWVYGPHVTINGRIGWSSAGGEASRPSSDRIISAWIDTDALAVRADPWPDAAMLDTRYFGDEVRVVGGEVNGYVPIDHWSGRAWLWAGFLRWDGAPSPGRWIQVERSSGLVRLWEGDTLVFLVWGAMSADQSDDGFWATANGTYWVYDKHADLTWTDYGNAWIRYYVAFDSTRYNGFHTYSLEADGTYAVNASAPTGGCIALDVWAAEIIYDFARIGTKVVVHW